MTDQTNLRPTRAEILNEAMRGSASVWALHGGHAEIREVVSQLKRENERLIEATNDADDRDGKAAEAQIQMNDRVADLYIRLQEYVVQRSAEREADEESARRQRALEWVKWTIPTVLAVASLFVALYAAFG